MYALRMYMVHFSPRIEQQKHFIIMKLTIWVWCGVTIMNGHDKAADSEPCLASS